MARRWPYTLTLALSLVPIAAFVAITGMLVVKSFPALSDPGWQELFSRRFGSQFTTGENVFGLLPAAWGTVLITVIAMTLAVPVSLAMAILASEFTLGPLGRALRVLIGVLGGIPSIVYALLAVVFVTEFMIPKFAGNMTFATFNAERIGANSANWPPADVPWNAGAFPWDPTGLNNSTLLGGVLIALLVIPFMAPLMDDAIRGVSTSLREASLGLGANRSHTLRRVLVPGALPGLVSAISLGALRAMGDTLIVVFVVGWEANVIPNTPVDVLERTPPLTAAGAGLLGGFQGNTTCQGAMCSVGYFTALLLLFVAVAVVVATSFLQTRLRAKYSS